MNLSKENALKLYNTEWWKTTTDLEIVKFQLFEDRLCVPFDIFHGAVENVLKRPVFTHEFGFVGGLQKEFLGDE